MEDSKNPTPPSDPAPVQVHTPGRVRAFAIDVSPVQKQMNDAVAGQSNVVLEDPDLQSFVSAGKVIEPPYDPLVLSMFAENSTNLEQNVAALEINIDGFGYKFARRVQIDRSEVPAPLREAVGVEAVYLENLFAHFCMDYSFTAFRRRLRRDIELTGNGYFEVVANGAGNIDQLVHVPSYQMRLTPIDRELTEFRQRRLVRQPDGSVTVESVKAHKRFRRIVQFSRLGTDGRWKTAYDRPIYFKEFGDPRIISAKTGNVLTEAEISAGQQQATQMVHFKIYCPRSPYGLPRYIGNLITLLGDRAADSVNYVTFSNNNMPSMIVIVSGGALTQGSIDRIRQFTEQQLAGSSNRSRFLIIEAESPYAQETGETGSPKLEIKPLTNSQIQDQLFQVYGDNNRKKIREAFRLPPIFVGRAETYNRATAEASRKLADEQIFAPERNEFDHWINHRLFPELEVKYHKFQSLSPNVTDDEDLLKLLLAAEKTGGMTPRLARVIIEDIMGREFPEVWKDMDPDVPFTLQLAERVKNTAAVGTTTQVAPIGPDVSTLKSMLGNDEDAELVLSGLLKLRRALEDELEGAEKLNA